MEGYGKRFGANMQTTSAASSLGTWSCSPSFFRTRATSIKGTGSIRSRALFAIGTAFVRKGDNRHCQPGYSDVLGGLAAGEISTLYYPGTSRPVAAAR